MNINKAKRACKWVQSVLVVSMLRLKRDQLVAVSHNPHLFSVNLHENEARRENTDGLIEHLPAPIRSRSNRNISYCT